MKFLRGKAFVRAWSPDCTEQIGKCALVGVVEIEGPVEDEQIHCVYISKLEGKIQIIPTGEILKRDDWDYGPDYPTDSILTQARWKRPTYETGLDGGGIFLREIDAPSKQGKLYHFISLLTTDEFKNETLVDLEGPIDNVITITGESCARQLQTNGRTLSQIMTMPIWGWDNEPWGMVSTMHKHVNRDCQILHNIQYGGQEEYPGQREKLEKGCAGQILSHRDPLFKKFVTVRNERYGAYRYTGVITQKELEEDKRIANEIIREIMN